MNDQAKILRQMVKNNYKKDNSFSKDVDTVQKINMNIITVASGKGGVGKSNFSVNLGLAMQDLKKRCLLLDADFGLANIEIILGERPKNNISSLIHGNSELRDVISLSKYGIPFISGGSGIKDMNFLSSEQIDSIANKLIDLSRYTDNLIIDTGAGINDVVVKFCKLANYIYIVVTPEPTSITDGYALIKTLVSQFNINIPIKIIINKAANQTEAKEVFEKLHFVAKEFLQSNIGYGGYIPYDDNLFKSAKEQIPILKYNNKSKSSRAYCEIAKNISEIDYTRDEVKGTWIDKFKRIFTN